VFKSIKDKKLLIRGSQVSGCITAEQSESKQNKGINICCSPIDRTSSVFGSAALSASDIQTGVLTSGSLGCSGTEENNSTEKNI